MRDKYFLKPGKYITLSILMYFVLVNDKSNGVYTRQFRCFPMKSFFSRQNTKCYHCYVEKQKNFTPKVWGGKKQAFTLKLDKKKEDANYINKSYYLCSKLSFTSFGLFNSRYN